MEVSRSATISEPTPSPPTSTTPAAASARRTCTARRIPASAITSTAAPAVAIQEPRLKDSTSGTISSSAVPPAARRTRLGSPGASAAAVATTSPYATTVAMPMMSPGPKVPTARMSSPW